MYGVPLPVCQRTRPPPTSSCRRARRSRLTAHTVVSSCAALRADGTHRRIAAHMAEPRCGDTGVCAVGGGCRCAGLGVCAARGARRYGVSAVAARQRKARAHHRRPRHTRPTATAHNLWPLHTRPAAATHVFKLVCHLHTPCSRQAGHSWAARQAANGPATPGGPASSKRPGHQRKARPGANGPATSGGRAGSSGERAEVRRPRRGWRCSTGWPRPGCPAPGRAPRG